MRSSQSNFRKPLYHRHWFLGKTLTSLTSPKRDKTNPVDFWNSFQTEIHLSVTQCCICHSPRKTWYVRIIDSICCTAHEAAKFKILSAVRKKITRVQTLDFRWADVSLLRELIGGIPQKTALKGKMFRPAGRSLRSVSFKVKNNPS